MQDERHAKLMPLRAKLLNYISLPYASAMLFTARRSCVDVSRLCTAGVFGRWRGVCLSPLSDIGDDRNINGLCRAEHKQCPGRFIQQSRGCDAAMSECEWSQTVLSVMLQTRGAVFGVFIWASFQSFYFKFRKMLEVKDSKRNPTYSSGFCTILRMFLPLWKHKIEKKKLIMNPWGSSRNSFPSKALFHHLFVYHMPPHRAAPHSPCSVLY